MHSATNIRPGRQSSAEHRTGLLRTGKQSLTSGGRGKNEKHLTRQEKNSENSVKYTVIRVSKVTEHDLSSRTDFSIRTKAVYGPT